MSGKTIFSVTWALWANFTRRFYAMTTTNCRDLNFGCDSLTGVVQEDVAMLDRKLAKTVLILSVT